MEYMRMEQVIPILPCNDTDALLTFYQQLGFTLLGKYSRGYLVVQYGGIELHFYASRKLRPEENASMCATRTDDVDGLYEAFTSKLKASTGKIPRSGFPRLSKIRDLAEDRRFTLTDPSGNTLYILTPKPPGSGTPLRDIDNAQYAKKFAALYDLIYSKEDLKLAANLLPQLLAVKDELNEADREKLMLLAKQIYNTE